MLGWICPKCNRSVNPKLDFCPCSLGNQPYTPFEPFKPKPYNPINDYKTITNETIDNTHIISNKDIEFNPL
jgi:hypothetical protein